MALKQGAEPAQATPQRRVLPMARPSRRGVLLVVGVSIVLIAALGLWFRQAVESDYRNARASVNDVRVLIPEQGSGQRFELSNLPELERRLVVAEADLRQLDDRVHVPIVTTLARHTPFIGSQVRASEDFIDLGLDLTVLARDGTRVANEVYGAYEQTGLTGTAPAGAPTWLTVFDQQRSEIDALLVRFDQIMADRAALDEEQLPDRAKGFVGTVDTLLEQGSEARELYGDFLDYYPMLQTALGAPPDDPTGQTGTPATGPGPVTPDDLRGGRYLVLLQNSQEIRQSGGFAGTYVVLTIEEGRLVDYSFESIGTLDRAYDATRTEVLPSPPAIAEYLKQLEWYPRDVTWHIDFREAAQLLLDMYADTGLPEVHGVIGVDFAAVEDIIRVTGPVTVEIESERVTVTEDNLIDVIESYRAGRGARHKEAVRIIGSELLTRLREMGLRDQQQVLDTLAEAAARRDIQMYSTRPGLQAEIQLRGWEGALDPDPETPTLAMTYSNIVGNKASRNIQAKSWLELGDGDAGATRVHWEIELSHRGDPDGDLIYNGYHRTWLAVYLPQGAELVSTSLEPVPEEMLDHPREVAFHVELLPGKRQKVELVIDLPSTERSFLLRRQSGINPMPVEVTGQAAGAGCEVSATFKLERDYVVDLDACTAAPARP